MRLFFHFFLLVICFSSSAQDSELKRCTDGSLKIECGWHYGYIDPLGEMELKEEKDEEKIPTTIVVQAPEELESCTNKDNWTEDCGFVDPGEDYDFQSIQRDVFLKGLLMKSHDPKSVENMQRYQRWLVTKAVEASKVWEYNLVNKPELSASIKNPVTSFGLGMATQLREDTTQAVIEEIQAQGGMFVWFTRSDCPFCHQQRIMMQNLKDFDDYRIRNVSLDETCMEGFEEGCITAPFSLTPASKLNVNIVPSIYVFIPKDDTWIRISNGLEAMDVINNRVKNFFLAVKSAHINGIKNGDGYIPSIDFRNKESEGLQGFREIQGLQK